MARTLITGSANALPTGSDNALYTWTAPVGGAHYVLVTDAEALNNGDTLYSYYERTTRNTDPRREVWRLVMAAHTGSGIVETPIFGAPSGSNLSVGLRLEGSGTERTIRWTIEQVDG